METAAVKPSATLRVSVAVAVPALSALLAVWLLGRPLAIGPTGQALCLLIIACATSAWLLYPLAGSVAVNAIALIPLLWAWAARQVPGGMPAAFGVLGGVAVWQRRRRWRERHRMQQVVDDLGEERRVQEQAVAQARQTRDALQKKLARYTQLQTIAESLSNVMDLGAIAQLAVDRTFHLIGKSDACLLFLVDEERQELALVASKKREQLPAIRAKQGDQFDRHVLRTHRPLLVNDARRDFRFTTPHAGLTAAASSEREISSVIACPLLLAQRPAGVLRLDSAKPGAYTQDDLRFLDILLDLVATAVTNARLFARTQQLAMTDGLTGLTLRRPFLEHLTRELTRAGRSREPVSVILLDVDRFKEYNDTFGHTAGDVILREVAALLRAAMPPGGLAARYGGEEFIVLLPRASRPQAREVAERIRRLVEQRVRGSGRSAHQPAAPGQTGGGVTASLGVATFPEEAAGEFELIRIADGRLYQAKHEGRNRVCAT
jgi:diguanylate cyclase (GGDEF)-like protein